jgi:type IV pilus assembly protein PilM
LPLFKKFQEIKEPLIGIDIGFDTLKLVLIKRKGSRGELLAFNFLPIPKMSLFRADPRDKQIIAEAIKQACASAKPSPIRTKLTATALPESKVFTKVIQIPKMNEDELEEAIPYEASRHVPLPAKESIMDWQVVGTSAPGTLDVLIVATPKNMVQNYVDVLSAAGLELIAIETKPIAESRALIKNEAHPVLFVDIGAEATSISVIDQKVIKFTYTIPHGGYSFTKAIMQAMAIPEIEAEKVKKQIGLLQDAQLKNQVFTALEPLLKDIISELSNAAKYYESRSRPTRKIVEIRLCGGGANTPGIVQYIQKATEIRTSLANPFVNLYGSALSQIPQPEALRYSAAIGLGLRQYK